MKSMRGCGGADFTIGSCTRFVAVPVADEADNGEFSGLVNAVGDGAVGDAAAVAVGVGGASGSGVALGGAAHAQSAAHKAPVSRGRMRCCIDMQ